MKRMIGAVLVLVVLVSLPLAAQQAAQSAGMKAILEYFQDSSGEMVIKLSDGTELAGDGIEIGMDVAVGSTIVTFDGDSAEVRLQPNGSIIRIAANTNFAIEGLQGVGGGDASRFAVAVGKIRNVAGKATGNERYVIKGASTVCGVRGTDWAYDVLPGKRERVGTFKGTVDFTNAAGETLAIVAGKFADALGETFQLLDLTEDILNEFMQDLEFLGLNPDEVPGQGEETAAESGTEEPPAATTAVVEAVPETTEPAEEPEKTPEVAKVETPKPESKILAWLREVLGMEIGSLTIGEDVYSKAVLQPTFTLGKLKLSLYLPIIYKSNMFDPADWYHPAGNDEWSFGTDKVEEGVLPVIADAASDLMLKIRYVQFGKQRDPFYFKIGNLNNITIGSGFIMRDFANDAEFPSVRRVGLNVGVDGKAVGFEVMANDLASLPPEIFGGRFYVKLFKKLAIGIGAVTDINPAGGEDTFFEPMFLHGGFNVEFPVINSDAVSLILFSDIATSVPYFKSNYDDPVSGETILAGMQTQAIFDADAPEGTPKLKNWGFAAGLFGDILIAKYRLEYRYFTGSFRPAYFDTGYERERTKRLAEVVEYLASLNDPATDYQNVTMGVYGEAGFSILKDKLSFSAGYMWPWVPGTPISELEPADWPDDFLSLKLVLEDGLIPAVNVHGSVSFERSRFISTLAGEGTFGEKVAMLFDANTLAKVEVIYPVAAIMDVALTVTSTVRYDSDGNLVLDAVTGLPTLDPSVGFEMRMHL